MGGLNVQKRTSTVSVLSAKYVFIQSIHFSFGYCYNLCWGLLDRIHTRYSRFSLRTYLTENTRGGVLKNGWRLFLRH